LILHATQLARTAVGGPVVVVLGDQAQRLRSLVRRHEHTATIVNNCRWQEGLATSLQSGLKRLPPGTRAVLILLVDQPRLESWDIARLISVWRRHPSRPAAARYRGAAGAPAVIPRSLFGEINSLRGDAGARSLLRRSNDASLVEMPAAEFDVDTPADAATLTESRS
jgi:CTP:molybdopterin cytidylyltransferase MocA